GEEQHGAEQQRGGRAVDPSRDDRRVRHPSHSIGRRRLRSTLLVEACADPLDEPAGRAVGPSGMPTGPWLLSWRFSPLTVAVLLAAASLYAIGVSRVRRRGGSVSPVRATWWYAGI